MEEPVAIPGKMRRFLGARLGDRLVSESDPEGIRVPLRKDQSPFAKYRGIGNPGLPSGRAAVAGWVRRLRGR